MKIYEMTASVVGFRECEASQPRVSQTSNQLLVEFSYSGEQRGDGGKVVKVKMSKVETLELISRLAAHLSSLERNG